MKLSILILSAAIASQASFAAAQATDETVGVQGLDSFQQLEEVARDRAATGRGEVTTSGSSNSGEVFLNNSGTRDNGTLSGSRSRLNLSSTPSSGTISQPANAGGSGSATVSTQ